MLPTTTSAPPEHLGPLLQNPEAQSQIEKIQSDQKTDLHRPKRNAKKQQNQDMIQFEESKDESGCVTPDKKKQTNLNQVNKNNIKNVRISDSQDPFTLMYKHIMEPILQLDRLEVLRENKVEFDVKLYPKDLKNLTKKDELIRSRVHIDTDTTKNDLQSMVIEINRDENFERHSKDRETHLQQQEANDSNHEEEEDEHDENDDELKEQEDVEIKAQSTTKKPFGGKKRRKKGKPLCQTSRKAILQQKKPYQTYLPQSLSECTWLENTVKNIDILDKKNCLIKIQRELKKQRDLERLQKINMRIQGVFQPESDGSDKEDEVKNKNDEDEDTPFIAREDLTNLDQIDDRFRHAYYPNLSILKEDINFIVMKAIKNRCQNSLAKIYLTTFLLRCQEIIRSKKREFIGKWVTYYKVKLYNNQASNCIIGDGNESVWYNHFDETTKRQYFEIQNYKTKVPGEEDENGQMKPIEQQNEKQLKEYTRINEIMKTEKKSQCNGECCMKPYQEVVSSNPKSHLIAQLNNEKCNCAKQKVECGPECGCDPKVCYNRQMGEKQSLRFGDDVEERVSWGMDICTQVNFLTIMPRNIPFKIQSMFVEKKLIYAIQQQENQGYDVMKALEYVKGADLKDEILRDKYTQQDLEIAQVLYDAILNLPEKNIVHFKIHSKGLGIFCKRKIGIKTNSLVIEYFGEIYRPWHWFEKQDIIKQGQQAKQLPNDLPEFYNITFERHLNDPDGYNILTVDPILHGNYSSRLSHSCFPNCQTINKVKNDQYSIGMFTNKDITYGEELCFDYCSFTESEKEFDSAKCLCGTAFCKGRFLNLANDKKNLGVMKNNHTFLDRNYIIYKAICQKKLTDEDNNRLWRNGLRNSALKEAPEWLKIWASLVCEYLEFEEELYPEFFRSDYPQNFSPEAIKIDARFQKETQIQNIAITIDKVTHVLNQMETVEPPIVNLSFEERYDRLWIKEGCLKTAVIEVINTVEKENWSTQVTQAQKLIDEIDNRIFIIADDSNAEEEYEKRYTEVRQVLANISDILRSVNSFKVAIPSFCDILMMYANTTEYFTQNEYYKRCKSNKVSVRNCDVKQGETTQMDKISQGITIYTGQKEYDSQYIWGQLVGWFKQTVNKPNASLSADRRGTLSIPDVQSFIVAPGKMVFEDSDQKPQIKKKRTKKGARESKEEIMPTSGSRTRPGRQQSNLRINEENSLTESPDVNKESSLNITQENSLVPHQRKLKIVYPSKRFSERKDFLSNWKDNFSKQWDVCCEWNFQNKMKMYGSLQFESIIRADKELPHKQEVGAQVDRYKRYLNNRMNYFDSIVHKLLQYNH